MVSIRRTLSPVPHPGNLVNGEASSIASPLSKSSSCNQDYSPSGGLASSSSSDHGIYKVQSFLSGIFSQRPSRSLERPKVKGQGWRRSVFHILICFCIGIFVGVTPFISMNMSMNYMSEEQEFPFKKFLLASENATSMEIEDKLVIRKDSVPLEPQVTNGDIENGTSDGTVVFESVYQDSLKLVVDQDSFEVFHKLLIIVTPTYTRPFQAYYLNRLAYTLKLVPPPLLWIVVEMNSQSLETANMLRRTGVMYRHLVCSKNLTGLKYMSAHQRNVALSHIENHRLDGIVYFADDANIYSTELFEQMRHIRRFGTWTVAKLVPSLSQTALEGPICNGTRVLGWHSNDVRRRFRRFHVQMSGFAFNSTVLWDPKRWHRPTLEPIRQLDTVKEEVQVSTFVEQVVEDEGQMEGLPLDCSKVMVWQVRIDSPTLHSYPPEWRLKNNLDVIFPHISEF